MLIFEAILYIFPSYIANGCATLSASIPILKKSRHPIDFGKSWKGKRILGNGKTIEGFIWGTLCGVLAGGLQYYIVQNVNLPYLDQFNNASLGQFLLLGFLLGFGALFGDMTKSFIKRRLGIKRGKPWIPFDQLDFLIGGLLFGSLVFFPGWKIVLILVIMTPLLHFTTNVIAYKLKLKNVWW